MVYAWLKRFSLSRWRDGIEALATPASRDQANAKSLLGQPNAKNGIAEPKDLCRTRSWYQLIWTCCWKELIDLSGAVRNTG